MSSSDESSDGGSYHESENDSSSDESSVQPTAGPGRSAEELIAAHRAGEYRVDLMREVASPRGVQRRRRGQGDRPRRTGTRRRRGGEGSPDNGTPRRGIVRRRVASTPPRTQARWLRDSEGLGGLDGGLRDALFSDPRTGNPLTIPVHGAADAVDGIDAGYLARRLAWGTESGEAVVRIFVLDEHVVLFHSGHPAGAHVCAYDRALVDEAAKNSLFNVESRTPAVTPLATTVLRGSAQDQHPEEVAMTYLHDLSTDDDGFWRCDWIPFADGSYRRGRSGSRRRAYDASIDPHRHRSERRSPRPGVSRSKQHI